MPTSNEIIRLGITVSSASVTRAGFDSILLVGDETMVDPTQAGPRGEATFDPGMVFKYTADSQVGDEIVNGHLRDMISVAFGQQPSVGTVMVSYVDTEGSGAGIVGSDIQDMYEYESNWIGYCSVFETEADVENQATKLLALGKFYSILTSDSSFAPTVNDYTAMWHTGTAYGTWSSLTNTSGRWANVASLSYFLAVTQGTYNPAFKKLQGIDSKQYTATEETTLRANNLNQYSEIGGQAVTWDGKNGSGTGYIDTYLGAIYLQIRLTEDLMNLMIQSPKIPYTDPGIATVGSVISNRLTQMTTDGYLDKNRPFTVNLPKASSLTDKASRNLPGVSFIAYTSGAINTIEIQGFIDAT